MNEASKAWVEKYPLHAACEGNDLDTILISSDIFTPLVNTPDNEEWYPAHYCCFMGHHAVLAWLLDHGANVVCVNANKATPLHIAIGAGQRECVITLLASITSREQLVQKNNEKETAIQLASYIDDLALQREIVQLYNEKLALFE